MFQHFPQFFFFFSLLCFAVSYAAHHCPPQFFQRYCHTFGPYPVIFLQTNNPQKALSVSVSISIHRGTTSVLSWHLRCCNTSLIRKQQHGCIFRGEQAMLIWLVSISPGMDILPCRWCSLCCCCVFLRVVNKDTFLRDQLPQYTPLQTDCRPLFEVALTCSANNSNVQPAVFFEQTQIL